MMQINIDIAFNPITFYIENIIIHMRESDDKKIVVLNVNEIQELYKRIKPIIDFINERENIRESYVNEKTDKKKYLVDVRELFDRYNKKIKWFFG